MKVLLTLAAISVGCWAGVAWGDGFRFQGNRITGEPTTVLSLTRTQRMSLRHRAVSPRKWDVRKIALTAKQQATLKREAGFAPARLEVYPLACARATCTCDLLNVAIRFAPDKVEVPHYLLGRNSEDRDRRYDARLAAFKARSKPRAGPSRAGRAKTA
ncbi:MAG: hypothetical protein FJ291_02730 [Planctomycetes bacterium]|nr:hypothetical protein [Planctomycetota bacterium]